MIRSVDGAPQVLGDVVVPMTFRSGDVMLLDPHHALRGQTDGSERILIAAMARMHIAEEESRLHIPDSRNQTKEVPALEEHPVADEPALKRIRIRHALDVAKLFE